MTTFKNFNINCDNRILNGTKNTKNGTKNTKMAPKTTKKLQLLLSIKWCQISMITNQFLIPNGIDNLLELYFYTNTNQLRNYIVTYNIKSSKLSTYYDNYLKIK